MGTPPQLWQVFAPPQAPLLFGGAGTSAPLCGPGGDRSLWLDPGQPLPCDPLPSRSCSPSQGLCWGQGWLHPLRCPPHGCLTPPLAVCPGGELCLSPHPAAVARPLAGTHKLWCSRLRIHYCFQTAAKGWAGGVPQSSGHLKTLRAPHCMGTPRVVPPAVALGLGGSGPRSMPSWPSRAPGPEDGAVGTQNHRGPPQTAWGGHGELGV